jgi:hypothetical protein
VNGSRSFISVDDSSGMGFANVIRKFLENKLELEHCRGQEYDSAANIKVKNSGVTKRILDQNPPVFYATRLP